MIYVEMNGRMGNQLFRYAFARMLQIAGGDPEEKLIFDFSNIEMERKKGEMPGWEDSLKDLHTAPYGYYGKKGGILMQETTFPEKAVLGFIKASDRLVGGGSTAKRLKWRRKFLPWMNRHGIYQMFTGYDYRWRYVPGRKLLAAPFECARYPEAIREVLLKEFTPIHDTPEKNLDLMRIITGTESVCVSVRRGNFLMYPKHNVCGADYFERAAQKMCSLVDHPVFIVFSDDVPWTKENLKLPGEVYYESGDDPAWEKLRLMYSCRHFIIANSTFSWWAQFLGTALDKKVIAPSIWYNDDYQPPLFERGWIRLEV